MKAITLGLLGLLGLASPPRAPFVGQGLVPCRPAVVSGDLS
jgi:hypothetical protein